MSQIQTDRKIAAELWQSLKPGHTLLAMLTTASSEGVPHATWMGTIGMPNSSRILTITSPDSLKVRNIRENPSVEWLISRMSRQELLYLRGTAQIVEDVAEQKRYWQEIPGKGQAFFLRYFNTGPGFAIIRTEIESAVLVVPEEFRSVPIGLEDLQPAGDPD